MGLTPILTVNIRISRRIHAIRGVVFARDILSSDFRSLKEGETCVAVYRVIRVCRSDVSCGSVVAQDWDILGGVWAGLLLGNCCLWSHNRRHGWRILALA